MFRTIFALAAALSAAPALAVVIPNDRENTAGTGVFLGPLSTAQRTYQLLIDDTQLTGIVGQQISGLRWRLPSAATVAYPAADASYTSFDIRLSGSVDPANRSLTFADNIVGAQTLVRSGPLNVAAGSYPVTSAPHPFGPTIGFDSPFLYTGGNLLVEFRSSGISGTSSSVDAVTTSTPGYGTLYSAAWTSSFTGTSGAQGNAIITDLVIVPEPGTMAVSAAGLLLLRRRR